MFPSVDKVVAPAGIAVTISIHTTVVKYSWAGNEAVINTSNPTRNLP